MEPSTRYHKQDQTKMFTKQDIKKSMQTNAVFAR